MPNINLINSDLINSELINLWIKYYNSPGKTNYFNNSSSLIPPIPLIPMLYNDFKKDSLLFIGLNPSFSMVAFRKIFKGTKYSPLLNPSTRKGYQYSVEYFYSWEFFYNYYNFILQNYSNYNFNQNQLIKTYLDIERLARDKYDYFKKFKDIAGKVLNNKKDWEYIDLVAVRNTSQNAIVNLINNKDPFILDQINLMINLICNIQPKVIIVVNAFVSKYLKSVLSLNFNKKIGTYTITCPCYNKYANRRGSNRIIRISSNRIIPVFLTGMLTGQRALDTGSYERLIWHIDQVAHNILPC